MKKFGLIVFSLFFLMSCASDDDNSALPDNEAEEITRVVLSVTQGGTTVDYTFDARSGNDAEQILLKADQTYQVMLSLWNDDETPSENVTNEVKDEADEHLVCYDVLDNTNVSIEVTDKDNNGLPLGLTSQWTTGSASTGGVSIVLKHQPDLKNSFGNTVNCSVGETDVSVAFPVKVE